MGLFTEQVCWSLHWWNHPPAFNPGALGKADSTHRLQGPPELNHSPHSLPLAWVTSSGVSADLSWSNLWELRILPGILGQRLQLFVNPEGCRSRSAGTSFLGDKRIQDGKEEFWRERWRERGRGGAEGGGWGREREGERTKPWSCTLNSFIQSCLKPVYLGLFC